MDLIEGQQVRSKVAWPEDERPGYTPDGGIPEGKAFTFLKCILPPEDQRAAFIQHLDMFDEPKDAVDAFQYEWDGKRYYIVTPRHRREDFWKVEN